MQLRYSFTGSGVGVSGDDLRRAFDKFVRELDKATGAEAEAAVPVNATLVGTDADNSGFNYSSAEVREADAAKKADTAKADK